jgi:protoheme IX farnesyltransferase
MALLIGAFPGAAPPLIGWAAATGSLDPAAWALFAIMVVWQIPHFLAIALYRQTEYARAGIRTVPNVRGEKNARLQALAWSAVLVPATLAPVAFDVAGVVYLVASGLLSVWFLSIAIRGARLADDENGTAWARRFFLASLVYLPALTVAFVADVLIAVPL